MGTVDYMSPEQAIDTRRADHRPDVYSLGCTIYRLVAGKSVYEAESDLLVIMAHCEAEIARQRYCRWRILPAKFRVGWKTSSVTWWPRTQMTGSSRWRK